MNRMAAITLALIGTLPVAAFAQDIPKSNYGPVAGDRELSISGTGTNDRKFDNGSFGLVGDYGWYRSDNMVFGIRQSVNYATIKGESVKNDFWNGSTRGYATHHFGTTQLRPFVGGSLGFIYGDGVKDTGFAGLETGVKYYVLPKTYLLGRADYQWFFDNSNDADDSFKDGAWALTVGMGYNF
ncbi:MAG: hypothetical protein ABR558_10135 [Thioalkalivibrio sp.]